MGLLQSSKANPGMHLKVSRWSEQGFYSAVVEINKSCARGKSENLRDLRQVGGAGILCDQFLYTQHGDQMRTELSNGRLLFSKKP